MFIINSRAFISRHRTTGPSSPLSLVADDDGPSSAPFFFRFSLFVFSNGQVIEFTIDAALDWLEDTPNAEPGDVKSKQGEVQRVVNPIFHSLYNTNAGSSYAGDGDYDDDADFEFDDL